jgi:hypothetical protein
MYKVSKIGLAISFKIRVKMQGLYVVQGVVKKIGSIFRAKFVGLDQVTLKIELSLVKVRLGLVFQFRNEFRKCFAFLSNN